jgi:LmeA-like phospholipid-binding
MSTDPTQPLQTPAPESEEPPSREPPTQAVPQWQAPPPPPPPGRRQDQPRPAPPQPQPQPDGYDQGPPTRWDRPEPPTALDQAPPTQWDRQPTQWDQPQARPPQPERPPQQWQQPQWQQEPQGERPGQWAQPAPAPGGQWAPQPPADQPPTDQPPRFRRRQRKRRVRRSFMALFTVIVVLIVLVIADRVALAVTENDMANQFTQNGFPVKPSVTIQGFPFLTQLAAKDFNQVDIAASNVPAGPVTISTVNATITGMHISSFSSSASARVDKITANAFISFGALAAAGGVGSGTGITVTPAGTNTVKITAGIGGVFSDTEEAQISQTGPQTISIKVLPGNSAVGSLLSAFGSFSFNLPKGVPASLKITGLTLNSQGLTVSAAATNATFSQ